MTIYTDMETALVAKLDPILDTYAPPGPMKSIKTHVLPSVGEVDLNAVIQEFEDALPAAFLSFPSEAHVPLNPRVTYNLSYRLALVFNDERRDSSVLTDIEAARELVIAALAQRRIDTDDTTAHTASHIKMERVDTLRKHPYYALLVTFHATMYGPAVASGAA